MKASPTRSPSVDEPEPRTLEVLLQETTRQLDASVQAVRDLDTRIEGLARFTAILVGLVVAGLSLWSRTGPSVTTLPVWTLVALALGFGSAMGSAGLAVWAYLGQHVAIGIDPERLQEMLYLAAEMSDPSGELVEAGTVAIASNLFVLARSTRRLRLALASWILSIVFLVPGAIGLFTATNP